ncbi:MAG: TonB-dependent receptor domain-containing protein [Caulobacteraceae bacterium]
MAAGVPVLEEGFLDSTYQEYAAFTNATWHIVPRLDLTFGGRLSHNDQVASQLLDSTALGGTRTEFDNRRSAQTVFTWSVAPRFKINDDTSVYARVATGYRPGGPNILPPLAPPDTPASYNADTVTSYEAGLKADWLHRTLSLDLAAYNIDWNDVQVFTFVNGLGILTNGGTAVSRGVEFTATARPTRGLTVSLNGAYTDAHLTEDAPPGTGGLNGDALPYVPKLSLNLSGDYQWTLKGATTAYVGADFSFVGARSATFDLRHEVPSFETVDLRAGIDTGRWTLEAYVRNLANAQGVTSLFSGVGTIPNNAMGVGVIRPRTVGLTLGARF